MKNLNHLISRLSMSALVLILGSASLETWGQNLDLTIPSLEMQLTSELDSKAKHEIMMGWTCCWAKQHIDSVHLEHSQKLIELQLKENQFQSQFTPSEPISTKQWATFLTLQLADIYTTYRGLKYNCVYEMNPIIGEQPSVPQMFLVKTIVLLPAIESDIKRESLTPQTMDNINLLMALVVGNNYNVWHGAERNCSKRS